MAANQERRGFFRLLGGALAGVAAAATIQGCDADTPTGTATGSSTAGTRSTASTAPSSPSQPMATFPPGPTTDGTNIPRLAEGGRLHPGVHRHQLEVLWSLDTDQKLVALTFDDGPTADVSPALYDVLDETKTKATFFMVGSRVLSNAKLLHGRMNRHEVGNHTHSHQSMFLKNDAEALKDLTAAHRAITGVLGREPTLLRPPYSHVNGSTLTAAAAMGYDIVMWDNYIGDQAYVNNEDQLVDDVIKAVVPGQIILGHDAGKARLLAIRNLPKIIGELRRRKYEFVTISELRQANG